MFKAAHVTNPGFPLEERHGKKSDKKVETLVNGGKLTGVTGNQLHTHHHK